MGKRQKKNCIELNVLFSWKRLERKMDFKSEEYSSLRAELLEEQSAEAS